MNITVQGVDITLTPEQLQQIDIEVKKRNKPTPEQRFLELIQNLEIRIDLDNYPNRIFFFKGDDIWFEYNTKYGYLWCKYSYVWRIFEIEYSMGYGDIRGFIKGLMEEHFKMQGVKPLISLTTYIAEVEKHFKI